MNCFGAVRKLVLWSTLAAICQGCLAIVGCGSGKMPSTQPLSPPLSPILWTPQGGDLRFQGIGAYTSSQKFLYSGVNGGGNQSGFPNYVGSPLQLGSGVCGPMLGNPSNCFWSFLVLGPPNKSSTAVFGTGRTPDIESDLDQLSTPDSVITSLDLEPAWNAYAISRAVSSIDHGYTGYRQHVAVPDLPTTVQRLTSSGQIVTALSSDTDGNIYVFSYSWTGDTTSKYEAIVVSTTLADAATAMQTLASQGYIVTALGGNRASGFQLVGTRLVGRTESRPALVSVNGAGLTPDPFMEGYVSVGFLIDDRMKSTTLLLEKWI